jgi:hypothetical protein
MERVSKIIKIRDNGTLYVETNDFFNLESVKDQIAKLINSSIYKNLHDKKNDSNDPKNK